MGTLITIAGADFSANSVGFIAPVSSGLRGWFYLGGTVAETQQDRAGIANATLAGSPTLHDGYVSFGGYGTGQWLQTAIAETSEITLLCVAKTSAALAADATRPMFVGNYGADAGNGGVTIGAAIYISAGTPPQGTVRLAGGQNNNGTKQGNISATFSTTDVTVWQFYAGRMEQTDASTSAANNARKLFNKTTAQTGTTNAYPRVPHSINLLRGGSGSSSQFGGSCDLAFMAVYNRVLTDAEVETIYQAVKTRLAGKHSITI